MAATIKHTNSTFVMGLLLLGWDSVGSSWLAIVNGLEISDRVLELTRKKDPGTPYVWAHPGLWKEIVFIIRLASTTRRLAHCCMYKCSEAE